MNQNAGRKYDNGGTPSAYDKKTEKKYLSLEDNVANGATLSDVSNNDTNRDLQKGEQSMSNKAKEAIRLVEELKGGSYAAYDKLFLAWHRPVFDLLLRLTGSREEAADIAQDVFLTLWTQREELDTSRTINALLFTITRRAAITYFRHKRAHNNYLNTLAWDEAGTESPDSLVQRKEIELLMDIAMNQMPEHRRRIYMSYTNGVSPEQIATQLGVSKDTVYTQLSIARKHMRGLMSGLR
jgi:RNA polymerase sigma-70 factor (ECF subfamily)